MRDFELLKAELAHRTRWQRRFCRVVTFGRHWYGDEQVVEVGPLEGLPDDFEKIGAFRQCHLCHGTVQA